MKTVRFPGFRTVIFCILALLTLDLIGQINQGQIMAQESERAKNVILMIGDGMGFNSDLAGTYYRFGEAKGQIYQKFPQRIGCTTYALTEKGAELTKDGSDMNALRAVTAEGASSSARSAGPGYRPEVFWTDLIGGQQGSMFTATTDSAAASTAINSGIKTKSGRIGVSFNGKPIKQFALYMAESGRSIGTVTTVTLCHATPAGVIAHNESRGNYEQISMEMITQQPMTVIIGGGNPEYHHGKKIDKDPARLNYQNVGGRALWEKIKKNDPALGFTLVEQKKDFEKIAASNSKALPKKLLGLPREDTYIKPVDGAIGENGRKLADKLVKKEIRESLPSLSVMSLAALNVLNQNDKGFFLMIEGGAIDGANHGNNMEMMVLEHTGFSKAIESVCEWIEKNSSWKETLLIITADHETGQLWGPGTWKSQKTVKSDKNTSTKDSKNAKAKKQFNAGDKFFGFQKIVNNGRGNLPGFQYASPGHSNALVPFYAKGAGSDFLNDYIRGEDSKAAEFWDFNGKFIDSTDITPFMKKAAHLK